MNNTNEETESKSQYRQARLSGIVIRYELLSILAAFVIHTLVAVWWGATMTTKLDFFQVTLRKVEETLTVFTKDQYTSGEANKDFMTVTERIVRNEKRIDILEKKMDSISIDTYRGASK